MAETDKEQQEPVEKKRGKLLRWLVLFAIVGMLLAVSLSPGLRAQFKQERVVALIEAAGSWGPVLFILVYAVWVTLFLPAIVPTIAGSLLFPQFPATVYIVSGASLGAAISFLLARSAGREFVARLLRGRIAAWDEGLARNGFLFVFYLRLLYVPFTYFNFAAGLTKVRFVHFFWGTTLGIIPGTFILVFFVDRLKELGARISDAPSRWAGMGEAGLLLISNPRYLVPLIIFISSFFIPLAVKRAQSILAARRESGKAA